MHQQKKHQNPLQGFWNKQFAPAWPHWWIQWPSTSGSTLDFFCPLRWVRNPGRATFLKPKWRPLGWKMIFRISIGSDFWGEPVEPAVHFLGCLGQKNNPPIYLEFYRCCSRRWFCLRLTIQKTKKVSSKKTCRIIWFLGTKPPPKKKVPPKPTFLTKHHLTS